MTLKKKKEKKKNKSTKAMSRLLNGNTDFSTAGVLQGGTLRIKNVTCLSNV